MKNDKQRLLEVMARLDKTFNPSKAMLNEGFEEIQPTDDIEVPVDADNEMPVDGGEEAPVEEKTPEEKLAELTAKVDELYALLHGEAEEVPAVEPEEIGMETGEVEMGNLQEWNFDKKKGEKEEGKKHEKKESPEFEKGEKEEEKEDVDEDVNITVSEKKGKALSADKAPEVEVGK